jgi:hypothetical protein
MKSQFKIASVNGTLASAMIGMENLYFRRFFTN